MTVHRDIPSLETNLEATGAKRVYADGGRTVQSFLALGRLAELTVTRVPVILGEGIPLFGMVPQTVHAQLISSKSTEQGAVQSVYRFV